MIDFEPLWPGERSLFELKKDVLSAVRAHTGGTLGRDDLTLMVAEVN